MSTERSESAPSNSPPRSGWAARAGRLAVALALAGAAGSSAGCGAKTGLWVPETEGGVDAAVDAPREPAVCLEPGEPTSEPLRVELSTAAQVAVADVLFVIDRTGSMGEEIDNIRESLRTVIVPGLARNVPDLQLGLVSYSDFPIDPYGSETDRPFSLDRRMGNEYTALQGALSLLRAGGGGDNPEALVEALYQIATGEGLLGAGAAAIPPAPACPTVGIGYACIRPRATPILVVIADAPSHNGPTTGPATGYPYNPALFRPYPAPHSYAETVRAINTRLRARVIGINSGLEPFSGRADLVALARDTGSIGEDGQPLVFNISPNGTGLGEQVVRAVGRFTEEVRIDVSARASDVDGSGGAALVRAIRPVRAEPMSRVTRVDESTFYGVVPGTRLQFALELDRSRVRRTEREQRYLVRVEFLADGRPTLGFRDVELVVPALSAPRCPDNGG